MKILRRYWPWLIPLAFVAIYEAWALLDPGVDTLSALVWEAAGLWPALALIVTIGLLVLLWHFFLQKKTWKR